MTNNAQTLTSPIAAQPAPSLFQLGNRTTLVTGGARGLGLTVAHALLESGSDVVCLDMIDPVDPEWSAAQAAAKATGTQLSYSKLDVTDAEAVEAAVIEQFATARPTHPVRGLFHSAGIQLLQEAVDFTPAQFRKIIDVNLNGSFFVTAAFARAWLAQHPDTSSMAGADGASVVLVASMSGRVANYGIACSAYNASKAGVAQLTRNLAMEWGKKGIRVNSLSPGYIRTALTGALLLERPDFEKTWTEGSLLGRLSTPDEFRGPVIFLLSDASSFVTGSDLVVDGGHTAV